MPQRRQSTSDGYEVHDGLKRGVQTRKVGILIIQVAHVADQKAVPSRARLGGRLKVTMVTPGQHSKRRDLA